MEQKNGQTEQGTAMPDQSDLERKRQMYNALCMNENGGLLLRPEKRKKCRLRWEVYNLVVYYFRWLVLHYLAQTAVGRMLLRRPRITGRKCL